MSKDIIFKGIATAIVTPFDEKNKINFDVFKKLINFQVDNGVNGIAVCGKIRTKSNIKFKRF